MASGRVIFHIDMNCFFASCEIACHEELKGKKICIAHDSLDKKGIVLTASYEAKRLGVKTTMPLYLALKVCPDLQIVEPHYDLYESYSHKFFEYLRKISPILEPASIDEGYLDVTGIVSDREYLNLAKKIQDDLLVLYKLPCSIGIAPNKFLAKMASDIKKPLGITVLRKKDVEQVMWPLPIDDLFGAGKQTCGILKNLGISTIGDLARYDKKVIINLFGENSANSLFERCLGNGSSVVDPNTVNEISSVSNAHTLDHEEFMINNLIGEMKLLSHNVCERLEEMNLVARNFNLTVKFQNFKTISKSVTIDRPTNDYLIVDHYLGGLLEQIFTGEYGVRLISVGASHLSQAVIKEKQLSFYDSLDEESLDHEVNKVLDSINSLIGHDVLIRGTKKKKIKDVPKK